MLSVSDRWEKTTSVVYSELKSVGHLGVCDVNMQAATAIGTQHGATVYKTVEDLLSHVDAVSVCVPTHYSMQQWPDRSFPLKNTRSSKNRSVQLPQMPERSWPVLPGRCHDRGWPHRAIQPDRCRDKEDRDKTPFHRNETAQPGICPGNGKFRCRRSDDPRYRYYPERVFPQSVPYPFGRQCRPVQRAHGVRGCTRSALCKPQSVKEDPDDLYRGRGFHGRR